MTMLQFYNNDKEKWLVFSIFFLAVIIRFSYIYFSYGFNTLPGMDEIFYDKLANNISDGLGFALKEGIPTTKKPPVYPYFLASVYLISEKSDFAAVRMAEIILGGICTVLIYFIAKNLAGNRIAIISSFLVMIDPLLIYISSWLLAHIMVYLFTALGVFFCVRTIENPSLQNQISAGIFWGLAGLSLGYNTFLFYPYLFIWGLIIFWNNRKQALKISTTLTAAAILVISIWTIRNYMAYKKFIPIVTSGGHRFMGSNNPRANGLWSPSSVSPRMHASNKNKGRESWLNESDYLWLDLLFSEKKDYNDYEVNWKNYKAGWDWIMKNPVGFLNLLPKKFYHLFEPLNPNSTFPKITENQRLAAVIFYCFIFPFFISGIYLSLASWKKYLIIYLTIVHSVAGTLIYYGDAQQRMFFTPFLSIFAALSLNKLGELWNRKLIK